MIMVQKVRLFKATGCTVLRKASKLDKLIHNTISVCLSRLVNLNNQKIIFI